MVRRFSTLVLMTFLIIFVFSDNQEIAMASEGKPKFENDDELSNETETRAIELLEPILDPAIKPIELLEPILEPTIKPIELLEPILNSTIKPGELLGPELIDDTK